MLSRIISLQLIPIVRCAPIFASARTFASESNKKKPKKEMKKIPINPADYRLKKEKPCGTPAKQPQDSRDAPKKQIGLYRPDKKVEYEWVDPTPEDTGLNPNYDKVDAPNKANYVYQEFGYKLKGPEPTRYFDWERHGRVTDF